MRRYLWITLTAASLAFAGCAEDGTKTPSTNATTPSTSGSNTATQNSSTTDPNSGRTTVSKPAIGGGETPATSVPNNTGSSNAVSPSSTSNAGSAGTAADADAARRDNTEVNQRDRSDSAVLPTDQSNAQKDLDLSAKIRQHILRNKEMSIKAQNVKVITTADGKVTLRGPVASEDEKRKVEQIAKDAAGADKVTSELEVAPE